MLYKETGMQKWAGMLVETNKAFEDPSAMMTQMREDSDFWSMAEGTVLVDSGGDRSGMVLLLVFITW